MATPTNPTVASHDVPAWNEKLVDFVLHDPVRRRLFLALVSQSPRATSDLTGVADRRMDATYKQLVKLRAKRLIVMKPDPADNRRSLCTPAPWIPVKTTPSGKVIDFGFIAVRVASGSPSS